MRTKHLYVLALVVGMLASQIPVAASTFVWRTGVLPPLGHARIYTQSGTALPSGGCTFTFDDHSPSGRAWVVRQLALSTSGCIAITEEGIPPADFRPPRGPSFQPAPPARASGPVTGSRTSFKFARPLLTSSVGYTQYWYMDWMNNMETKVEVDIDWYYNGSCVSSVTASGGYYWWPSFNSPTNTSTSADVDRGQSCVAGHSVANGYVYGTFASSGTPSCAQFYQPAQAQGDQSGGIWYGSPSISSTCPYWMNYGNTFKSATPGG